MSATASNPIFDPSHSPSVAHGANIQSPTREDRSGVNSDPRWCVRDVSIRTCLDALEKMLDPATERLSDPDYFMRVGAELRRLHARIRAHQAADFSDTSDKTGTTIAPELMVELEQLRAEHPALIGKLDRLVRSVESIADRPLEDIDVFILRLRELIAILRRHEAEEDRIFYMTVWQDTGGES